MLWLLVSKCLNVKVVWRGIRLNISEKLNIRWVFVVKPKRCLGSIFCDWYSGVEYKSSFMCQNNLMLQNIFSIIASQKYFNPNLRRKLSECDMKRSEMNVLILFWHFRSWFCLGFCLDRRGVFFCYKFYFRCKPIVYEWGLYWARAAIKSDKNLPRSQSFRKHPYIYKFLKWK